MLVPIYGSALPERWLEERFVSFRRLLVLVRYQQPGSPIHQAEDPIAPSWGHELDLLDDIRRALFILAKAPADPHPDRPSTRAAARQAAAKAARHAQKVAESRAHDAARQARLAARKEERP